MSDDDFDSALKWSHDYTEHPPPEPGISWFWIVFVLILITILIWWHWATKPAPKVETKTVETPLFESMKQNGKSGKSYLMVDHRGLVSAK